MDITVIFCIIVGIFLITFSYVFSEKKLEEKNQAVQIDLSEQLKVSDEDLAQVRKKVVEAIAQYEEEEIERTKEQLSTVSNEKIMAIDEFTKSVLGDIDNNHKEVMFLYSMLTDKQNEIKDLVSQASNLNKQLDKKEKEVEEKLKPEKAPVSKKKEQVVKEYVVNENVNKQISKKMVENLEKESNDSIKEYQYGEEANKYNELVQDNNSQIMRLYEQGLDEIEIARKLDLGIGEVKLVVGLYENKA